MRVIIAGSRSFKDYDVLINSLANMYITEVVSGTARGADKLGERYAKENNISIKLFPADWNNNGKSAGFIRNEQMAKYADACVCFWDGKSPGTKHMINLATKYELNLKVIKY